MNGHAIDHDCLNTVLLYTYPDTTLNQGKMLKKWGGALSAIITSLHRLQDRAVWGCHGDAALTSHFLLF